MNAPDKAAPSKAARPGGGGRLRRGQPAQGDPARRRRVVLDQRLPPDPSGRRPVASRPPPTPPTSSTRCRAGSLASSRCAVRRPGPLRGARAEASTFTARVVASTLSDMHSAVSAAVGARRRPAMAGRQGMRTPRRSVSRTGRTLHAPGARRGRYSGTASTGGDPRAKILRTLAAKACRNSPSRCGRDGAEAPRGREPREGPDPERRLLPAPLQGARDSGRSRPVIAVSRVAGWTANLLGSTPTTA